MPIFTWENLISCYCPGSPFIVSQIGWPRLMSTINVKGDSLPYPSVAHASGFCSKNDNKAYRLCFKWKQFANSFKLTFQFLSIKVQRQSQFLYSNRIHAQILTNSNFLRTWKIWPIFLMVLICMWWIYLTYFTRLNKGVCFWNLELPLNVWFFSLSFESLEVIWYDIW